jgi:hypothetical protein
MNRMGFVTEAFWAHVLWVWKWVASPRKMLRELRIKRARFNYLAARLDDYVARLAPGKEPLEGIVEICARGERAEADRKRLADLLAMEDVDRLIPYLTPAEIERLALLGEGCGGVARVVGKILRDGYDAQPPHGGLSNRIALAREVGEVKAICELMLDAGDLRAPVINSWRNEMRQKMRRTAHRQGLRKPE